METGKFRHAIIAALASFFALSLACAGEQESAAMDDEEEVAVTEATAEDVASAEAVKEETAAIEEEEVAVTEATAEDVASAEAVKEETAAIEEEEKEE